MEVAPKSYTKTGDCGQTSLGDGTRHEKSADIFHVLGAMDELNSLIGIARADYSKEDNELEHIQKDLFLAGAIVCGSKKAPNASEFEKKVSNLEEWIDRMDAALPQLKHFILDGGCPFAARLHFARAVCRRAERGVQGLKNPADAPVLKYLNRLSSYLFARARYENMKAGVKETEWKAD